MLSRFSTIGQIKYCSLLVTSKQFKFVVFKSDNAKCASNPGGPVEEKSPTATSSGEDEITLDLSFNNHKEAFRSKYNSELVRAYVVYMLCSKSFIVRNNILIMNVMKSFLGKTLFEYVMKKTIYGHFVAGEDKERIVPSLTRMIAFGVYPVLDYSVEEDISEQEAVKREFEGIVSEVERKKPKDPKRKLSSVQGKPCVDDAKDNKNDTMLDVAERVVPQYKYHDFGDRRKQVSGARTYFYYGEETCDRNLEVFKECVNIVGSGKYGPGVAAVKLTALGRPQLLMQISEVIVKARRFVAEVSDNRSKETNVLQLHLTEEQLIKGLQRHGIEDTGEFLKNVIKDEEGVMHLFPWFGIIDQNYDLSDTFRIPSLKDGRMVRLITQLTEAEEQMFRNFIKRCNSLFTLAKELNVPVMVDAEQTYFQPAISRIAMEMMHKYNTQSLVVCNTYQCYLKETFNEAQNDLEQARRENFYFGAKLVRGAYLQQERARAAKIGYADPTCESFEATTNSMNKTFDEFIKYYEMYREKGLGDKVRVMLASHNEESVSYVIQRMKQKNISPSSGTVFFGQLLGMCDFISFPLGQSGYLVYKYVPYGPVAEVLPYLSRRVVENNSNDSDMKIGAFSKTDKEKQLVLKELARRIASGQLRYVPKPPSNEGKQRIN